MKETDLVSDVTRLYPMKKVITNIGMIWGIIITIFYILAFMLSATFPAGGAFIFGSLITSLGFCVYYLVKLYVLDKREY